MKPRQTLKCLIAQRCITTSLSTTSISLPRRYVASKVNEDNEEIIEKRGDSSNDKATTKLIPYPSFPGTDEEFQLFKELLPKGCKGYFRKKRWFLKGWLDRVSKSQFGFLALDPKKIKRANPDPKKRYYGGDGDLVR